MAWNCSRSILPSFANRAEPDDDRPKIPTGGDSLFGRPSPCQAPS